MNSQSEWALLPAGPLPVVLAHTLAWCVMVLTATESKNSLQTQKQASTTVTSTKEQDSGTSLSFSIANPPGLSPV